MLSFFKILLLPLSCLYRAAVFFWDIYWRKARAVKLPCQVISVGNIAAGGTGKTPVVIYLARLAVKKGLKTAVVAGGYKRQARGLIKINSDSSWVDVGDEPLEIFRQADGADVYVCESKTKAAQQACRDGAQVIIIDDGFQHRRLYRDLDIVCLDWENPMASGRFLPYGLLREPSTALKRADIIIYSNYNDDANQPGYEIKAVAGKKIFRSVSKISRFKSINSSEEINIDRIAKSRVIAFCGLAAPEKFIGSLKRIGILPLKTINFRDHYRYAERDIDKLKKIAAERRASAFITTGKDAVKIESFDFGDFNVYYAMLEIEITDRTGRQLGEYLEDMSGL
jgi:tetraacyldisaccharide 4'-kinase